MTAKMYPSTYKGKPCFAVRVGRKIRKFRTSDLAAAWMLQEMKK